jgi:hypothetical protein
MEQGFYLVQVDKFLRVLDALKLRPEDVLSIARIDVEQALSAQERKFLTALRAGDHAALLDLIAKGLRSHDGETKSGE